jgi:hypothetical protein
MTLLEGLYFFATLPKSFLISLSKVSVDISYFDMEETPF